MQVRAGTSPHGNRRKGPLPLVVAVTGHRDLCEEDTEALRRQVQAIFRELDEAYPFTPIELLCGLAEGADRLAARVALESAVTLLACLPMDKALYETDFATADSRREFEDLLLRAREIITMPLADGSTPESIKQRGPRRDAQYQILAEYLVQHSQILIALWDGVDTKLIGGTASVVKAQLVGDEQCNVLDFPETGPVYHILTPRRKDLIPRDSRNPNRPIKPLSRITLFHPGFQSDEVADASYQQIYGRMNAFNRDAIKKEVLSREREKSKDDLLPIEVRRQVNPLLAMLIEHYATADTLAIYYQQVTKRIFKILFFFFGFVTLLVFELFAHISEILPMPMLLLYLALIFAGYGMYKLADHKRFKTKHLDYRALAEGVRVQIFWNLAGVTEQVVKHYLRKQKTDLEWIRNAIRVWSAAAARAPHVNPDPALVQKYWIKDQADFFRKRAEEDSVGANREKWVTYGLLMLTVLLALGALVALFTHRMDHEIHQAIVVTMALLPGLAGAFAGYSLKMAHREQCKQYQRMRNIFQRGAACLERALLDNHHALATRLILDLGDEALAENGDWVLLHRERTIEVPWR